MAKDLPMYDAATGKYYLNGNEFVDYNDLRTHQRTKEAFNKKKKEVIKNGK